MSANRAQMIRIKSIFVTGVVSLILVFFSVAIHQNAEAFEMPDMAGMNNPMPAAPYTDSGEPEPPVGDEMLVDLTAGFMMDTTPMAEEPVEPAAEEPAVAGMEMPTPDPAPEEPADVDPETEMEVPEVGSGDDEPEMTDTGMIEPNESEAAICSGPADNSRCVEYPSYGVKHTVTHQVNVFTDTPVEYSAETIHIDTTEVWDPMEGVWVHSMTTETSTSLSIANGVQDIPGGPFVYERIENTRTKEYSGEGAVLMYETQSGTVVSRKYETIGGVDYLVEDTNYSYMDDPSSKDGHQNTWSFDAAGNLTGSTEITYTGSDETKMTRTDTDGDGILDTCSEEKNGQPIFNGLCSDMDMVA